MKKLLSYARVSEVGDAGNRISCAYQKNSAAHSDAFLAAVLSELSAMVAEITEAVKRDTVASQLEEADADRDAEVRTLGNVLKGYKAIPIPTLKRQGERLSAIFEKYGAKIADASYTEESNLVDAMLMDFSAADLVTPIASLQGVPEAIANLRDAQDNFKNIRGNYDSAIAAQKEGKTATMLRKPLLQLINQKLIPYLDALAMANPAIFGSLAGEVSQIIDTININVKTRMAKPEEKSGKGLANH